MYKAFKYRLYPTEQQKVLLEKHFGCARFIYNIALETKILSFSGTKANVSAYDLMKQTTELKKDCPWLTEVSNWCLQNSISDMDAAYSKFIKGQGNFPRFKNKKGKNSFRVRREVKLSGTKLKIPKFQEGIKIVNCRNFDGTIQYITISKTPTNKYFASLMVKTEIQAPSKHPVQNAIGVDLGIKTFAVLSNGDEFASPKILRSNLSRLKVLQRRSARKKKGSANRRKANLKVALLHEHISNKRNDFLHKLSNQITNDYDTICMETLNVAGMVKNHNLALSIIDASWSEFVRQLKYKSEWHGNNFIQIGRFEPTSKKCSGCGKIKSMPLSERTYNCECGLSIDRDINAAINIRNSGVACSGVSVELPTIVGAKKQKRKSLIAT